MSARKVAIEVLVRVAREQAWAAPALDAELARSGCDSRDSALAAAIVYGALRTIPSLDAAIDQHLDKKRRPDEWLRAVFRAAAFQILYLERVAPYAVVDESVTLVRTKRGKAVAGFVNAVLRRVAERRPESPKLPGRLEVPSWLERALLDSLGKERMELLLRLEGVTPSLDLRVRAGYERDEVAAAIQKERPQAKLSLGKLSPQCLHVRGAGDLRELALYRQGAFVVQEEGAQWLGREVMAQPGRAVLDVCAGRGGKTLQILEQVGQAGRVVANDLHRKRVDQIPQELERLQNATTRVETYAIDFTRGIGELKAEFDIVFVDAPCTGLGTLRRRPEILLRLKPADITRMADIQAQILVHAVGLVKPGGRLLYAVCSPLSAECQGVIEACHDALKGLKLRQNSPVNSQFYDKNGIISLGPWWPGAEPSADAYQLVIWDILE